MRGEKRVYPPIQALLLVSQARKASSYTCTVLLVYQAAQAPPLSYLTCDGCVVVVARQESVGRGGAGEEGEGQGQEQIQVGWQEQAGRLQGTQQEPL
jgi:hypothetical protein